MFKSALAQFIGDAGGGQIALLVQFVLLALTLGIMYFVIIRPLEKRAREHADLLSAASAVSRPVKRKAAVSPHRKPKRKRRFRRPAPIYRR